MMIGSGMPRSQRRMPRPMMNLLNDHGLLCRVAVQHAVLVLVPIAATSVRSWSSGIVCKGAAVFSGTFETALQRFVEGDGQPP